MATGSLSIPFRVTAQGPVATAPYGSDQEIDEAIASLTLTHLGERIMEPDYGITDPTWNGITVNDVETGIQEYGPQGANIVAIQEDVINESQSAYTIEWEREAAENEDL